VYSIAGIINLIFRDFMSLTVERLSASVEHDKQMTKISALKLFMDELNHFNLNSFLSLLARHVLNSDYKNYPVDIHPKSSFAELNKLFYDVKPDIRNKKFQEARAFLESFSWGSKYSSSIQYSKLPNKKAAETIELLNMSLNEFLKGVNALNIDEKVVELLNLEFIKTISSILEKESKIITERNSLLQKVVLVRNDALALVYNLLLSFSNISFLNKFFDDYKPKIKKWSDSFLGVRGEIHQGNSIWEDDEEYLELTYFIAIFLFFKFTSVSKKDNAYLRNYAYANHLRSEVKTLWSLIFQKDFIDKNSNPTLAMNQVIEKFQGDDLIIYKGGIAQQIVKMMTKPSSNSAPNPNYKRFLKTIEKRTSVDKIRKFLLMTFSELLPSSTEENINEIIKILLPATEINSQNKIDYTHIRRKLKALETYKLPFELPEDIKTDLLRRFDDEFSKTLGHLLFQQLDPNFKETAEEIDEESLVAILHEMREPLKAIKSRVKAKRADEIRISLINGLFDGDIENVKNISEIHSYLLGQKINVSKYYVEKLIDEIYSDIMKELTAINLKTRLDRN